MIELGGCTCTCAKRRTTIDESLPRAHFLLCLFLIVLVHLLPQVFSSGVLLQETMVHYSRLLITNSSAHAATQITKLPKPNTLHALSYTLYGLLETVLAPV